MNNQTSTDELLIYCLGMKDGPPEAGEFKRLTSSDWDGLIRGAIRYNVAPLLYHRLKGCSAGEVIPADVVRKLRESYLNNALKNVHLYQDLSKVIRAFQSKGIPVIVLKGAHLAKVVYGNIALRRMCDLDLLVKKEDLPRAVNTLMEMNYYSPYVPFKIKDACDKSQHLPPFINERAVPIEIHWHIVRPDIPFFLTIDIDGLWKRAQPAIIDDVQVLVLSPEDLILHLCTHIIRHIVEFIGLRSFCDLSEIIRHYQDEIDWEQLQIRSKEWRMDRTLYPILSLLKELLGESVPEDMLGVLKSNSVDADLVAELRECIILEIDSSSSSGIMFAQILRAKRLKDKAACFLEILKKFFPSRQCIAQIYHIPSASARVYFYYPVRLKDLIFRNGYIVWQLFRRDEEIKALIKLHSRQLALKDRLMPV